MKKLVKLDGLRFGELEPRANDYDFIECCDVICNSNIRCKYCILDDSGIEISKLEVEEVE